MIVTVSGHVLSPRNTVLCYFQQEGVSIIGGFRQWLKEGRCVRKGEKGMNILVPCNPKKGDAADQAGDSEQTTGDRVFFVAGTVFDVSQTDEVEAKKESQAPAVTVIGCAEVVQSELF